MKKLVLAVATLALVGCATPQQNAMLAGAVLGAVVAGSVHQPRHVHVHPAPPVYYHYPVCRNQPIFDPWGRHVGYRQVCY